MFANVSCTRVYDMIRHGVSAEARRLGIGRNLHPPCHALQQVVERIFSGLFRDGRFAHYDSEADLKDRELAGRLLGLYLDRTDLTADNIFFTNGAQEAISIASLYASTAGFSLLLPLPGYYSYEESAVRHSVPIAGYYNSDGEIKWTGAPQDRLMHTVVLPNAIAGSVFPNPLVTARREAGFTLVDAIYQMGELHPADTLRRLTCATINSLDLAASAFIFTISKDLSLPGFRAGVLISGNPGLMHSARADRFERIYSVNPLIGRLVAVYLALLLMHDAMRCGHFEDVYCRCRDAFECLGLEFVERDEIREILASLNCMAAHNRANLSLVQAAPGIELDDTDAPFAGYSLLVGLARPFCDAPDFLDWVHWVGLNHHLKLNPTYMFGGTPEIWAALYRKPYRIRINIAEQSAELGTSVGVLSRVIGLSRGD